MELKGLPPAHPLRAFAPASPAQPLAAPTAPVGPRESVELGTTAAPQVAAAPVAEPAVLSAPVAPASSSSSPVANSPAAPSSLQVNSNGTLSVFHPHSQPDARFVEQYGPWGVITGASSPVGSEYARLLAEKGMNVVLVTRNPEKLKDLSLELKSQHGVDVRVVQADLGSASGVQQVIDGTSDLQVGMLVNNAVSRPLGKLAERPLEKDVQSVAVNVEAPLLLTHHFGNQMAQRGQGAVVNVSSTAALHGVPGQAAYSAGQGFLQNFTEALYHELKPKGVDVQITNPGAVAGQTQPVSWLGGRSVSAREVAENSLNRLGKGSSTVPGWLNRLALRVATTLVPRDMLASIAGYCLDQATPADGTRSPRPAPPPAPLSTATSRAGLANDFLRKYGPWGVITGASQGIGAEYAEQLASKGMNVVLVARSKEKLEALGDSLRSKYGVEVKVIAGDLSSASMLEQIHQETSKLDIGLLVNNAGTWQFGDFLQNQVERDRQAVALNSTAPLVLSHEFGKRFAARGGGGIVNVGSGAALHGVPGQAAYSATKGFMRNLNESLHQEFKNQNVRVVMTNPGPVIGDASQAYDQSKVPLQKVTAETVVDDSLRQLDRQGSQTIPGWFNKLAIGVAAQVMPRDILAGIAGWLLKNATPH